MRHSIPTTLLFSLFISTNTYASSLLNISAWGFADNQTPHIACSIISGSSSERATLLVYAEANRTVNNRTDPVIYVGRPGNPLTNSENYIRNDDWSTDDAALMIQAVGRTPNNRLDSGVFISAPAGPICIYAYELNTDSDIGRINIQLTFLGNVSNSSARNSDEAETAIKKLSPTDALDLFNAKPAIPNTKILPANTDNVTTLPRGLK